MGFFSGLKSVISNVTDPADFFGARSGEKAASDSQSNMKNAIAMAKNVSKEGLSQAQEAAQQGRIYDEITARNLGGSAADYMARQQEAAKATAGEAGRVAATQGSKAAVQAGRTAGLSKGQAALVASQGAGDIYTNAFGRALEQDKGQYNAATAMQADRGSEMNMRRQNATNIQLGAAGIPAGIGTSQGQVAQAQKASTMGAVGGAAAALGPMLMASDERLKTNVKDLREELDNIDLNEIRAKVRPVKFEYDEDAVELAPEIEPGETHLGVIAQDLEDTALAPAVITDEKGIKRIDSAELAPALLNLIIQLSSQVKDLQSQLNSTEGE